jgi:hypothetical protein
MIELGFRTLHLKKRFPLRISRGEITGSDNLFVSASDGTHTGWGEMAPGPIEGADSPAAGETMLRDFAGDGLAEPSIHRIWAEADAAGVAPARWPPSTWRCGICARNRLGCRSIGCWGSAAARCQPR